MDTEPTFTGRGATGRRDDPVGERYTARGAVGPEAYPQESDIPDLELLRGLQAIDANGERIGTVEDVFVDERAGCARDLAIRTGFMGPGGTRSRSTESATPPRDPRRGFRTPRGSSRTPRPTRAPAT